MADDEQSKGLTLNIPGVTDIFNSIWAKILAILTVISIVLGIALEVQSFITGYYVLQKSIEEAKAASYQPALVEAQAIKAEQEAMSNSAYSMTEELPVVHNLQILFDSIDPNRPAMIVRGVKGIDTRELRPYVCDKARNIVCEND